MTLHDAITSLQQNHGAVVTIPELLESGLYRNSAQHMLVDARFDSRIATQYGDWTSARPDMLSLYKLTLDRTADRGVVGFNLR